MSLKQDLGSAYTTEEMTDALNSVLTVKEKAFASKEANSLIKAIGYFGTPKSKVDKIDKKWSEIEDSRIRMLIALYCLDYYPPLLTLSLLPELPIEVIIRWMPTLKTLSYNPVEAANELYLNKITEIPIIITVLWRLFQNSRLNLEDLQRDTTPASHLLTRFLTDDSKTNYSKLELCFSLQEINLNIQPDTVIHFPSRVTEIKDKLLELHKVEQGLVNLPEEWVREMFPSRLVDYAEAVDSVFV